MCCQRAWQVSPIRVPWASIISASMPPTGCRSKALLRLASRSGTSTGSRPAGRGASLPVQKSRQLTEANGFASMRPCFAASASACCKPCTALCTVCGEWVCCIGQTSLSSTAARLRRFSGTLPSAGTTCLRTRLPMVRR
ncbi:hypothetical protein D9M70_610900 [compost metagenome]